MLYEERKIRQIITEAVMDAINENSHDRAMNAFIKNHFNVRSFEDARNILFNVIYKKFPDLRCFTDDKAMFNVITYFFRPDGSINDADRLNDLKYVIHTLASGEKGYYREQLRDVMYGLANPYVSPDDSHFGEIIDDAVDKYYPESYVDTEEYSQKTTRTPNGYTVTRIDRFGELGALNGGAGWCVADDPEYFRGYIGDHGTPYFLEKKYSWDNVPDEYYDRLMDLYYEYETTNFSQIINNPECGKFGSWKFPYDINGLSRLFVIVYPNHHMDIFSQWNLTDENGRYLTKQQLSQLLGVDADKVIVPVRGVNKGGINESYGTYGSLDEPYSIFVEPNDTKPDDWDDDEDGDWVFEDEAEYDIEGYDASGHHIWWHTFKYYELDSFFSDNVVACIVNHDGRKMNGGFWVEDIPYMDNESDGSAESVFNMLKRISQNGGESGFLLPDGEMVFSFDHAGMAQSAGTTLGGLLNMGVIRVKACGIELTCEPTSEQYNVIRRLIDPSKDYYVDYAESDDGGLRVRFSAAYYAGQYNRMRPVNDIVNYFSNGVAPSSAR